MRRNRAWESIFPVLVTLVFGSAGCGGDAEPVSPPAPVPTQVAVSPAEVRLEALGATVQLSATVTDQNGQAMSGVSVTWVSGDPAIATVTAGGLVTAVSNGSTRVTASVGTVSGGTDVTVEQLVTAADISAPRDTLFALGDTVRLSAAALDANGNVVPDAQFTWASADTLVATVDSGGLVTAVSNGRVEISATSSQAVGSAAVTVAQRATEMSVSPMADTLLAGDTVRLTAEPTDANGHPVASAELAWSSTDGSIATVDSRGLVTGLSSGSVEITAVESTAGLSGTVSLVVIEPGDALGALYDALGGDDWTNSDNWETNAPLNTWYGVSTDEAGRVTEINLSDNNLLGSIPAEIAWLENLEVLDLSSNGLYAEAVGDRTSVAAYTEIEVCGFPQVSSRRGVTGPLPPELGTLSRLRMLNLAYNSLTDSIPGALGDLSSLEILNLGYNTLSGSIPEELGKLRALRVLNLCRNSRATGRGIISTGLTGSLPRELGDLTSLEVLNLGSNSLSGSLPPELGRLSSLRTLDLSRNARFRFDASTGRTVRVSALDGPIPPQLGDLEHLELLDLSQNALSGPIPPELGGLRSLTSLDLSGNAYSGIGGREGGLTGEIPPELGSLTSLEYLDLDSNGLTGSIPPELGRLVNLSTLHLNNNTLAGPIPPELGELRSLRILRARSNAVFDAATQSYTGGLSGPIPPQLDNLQELFSLELRNNNLSGLIPPQLGNLKELAVLDLSTNNLSGNLPAALAGMESLGVLHIDNNPLLTGAIPGDFVALRLHQFVWDNTDLCIPAGGRLRAWWNALRSRRGSRGTGVSCPASTDSVRLDFNSRSELRGWSSSDVTRVAVRGGILYVESTSAEQAAFVRKDRFLDDVVTNWQASVKMGRGQNWGRSVLTLATNHPRYRVFAFETGSGITVGTDRVHTNWRVFFYDADRHGPGEGSWVYFRNYGYGSSALIKDGEGEFTTLAISVTGDTLRIDANGTRLFAALLPPAIRDVGATDVQGVSLQYVPPGGPGGAGVAQFDWLEVKGQVVDGTDTASDRAEVMLHAIQAAGKRPLPAIVEKRRE